MVRGGKRTGGNGTLGLLSLFPTGCQIGVQDIFSVPKSTLFGLTKLRMKGVGLIPDSVCVMMLDL